MDVLIYADTVRSPEMRHEVPLPVPDPFLYVEARGERRAVVSNLEVDRVRGAGLPAHALEEFGYDDLLMEGVQREDARLEVAVRACREFGVADAAVPPTFPLALADLLRANGIEVRADRALFTDRRRAKNEAELAGIRRAQRGTEAAMEVARDMLRRAETVNGTVMLDDATLTCERLKIAIQQVFSEHDLAADEFIVAHGPQTAIGHEMGSGPIAPGEPVVIDLFPRDRESACHTDMTRTFVVGEPPAELLEYQQLCLEALERSLEAIRPGEPSQRSFEIVCEIFNERGYATPLHKEPGQVLRDGFIHSLGHGVGLEVHEAPSLARSNEELIPGDVVSVEPGLYRQGFGGCRLEDLVVVTEDGFENLTNFSYDLEP